MNKIKYIFYFLIFFISNTSYSQQIGQIKKGSLFIIGGGKRTPDLMRSMLRQAHLKSQDYIVVLPMASIEPDTAYFYFKTSLNGLCNNTIVSFNLTKENQGRQEWIDSLSHAALIF